jgi:hypothetical protein
MFSTAFIILVLLSVVTTVSSEYCHYTIIDMNSKKHDVHLGGNIFQRIQKKRAVVSGCTLTSEIEEGPYYYNGSLVRPNIT